MLRYLMCITISAQSVSLGWLQFGPGVMENIFKSVGGKSGLGVRRRRPLGLADTELIILFSFKSLLVGQHSRVT